MTRYITLAEFVWLATQVTSLEATVITNASRIDLADSALHAPAAGLVSLAEDAPRPDRGAHRASTFR